MGAYGSAVERVARRASADLRALPDFVIIGAQKAGTTSLWRYLVEHPQIVGPTEKEIHFFDARFDRGARWYRARFPLRASLRRGARLTFEASPYYLAHPFVPARVRAMLPDAKLVVLLRDPVERAWSHYRDNVARIRVRVVLGRRSQPRTNACQPGRDRIAADSIRGRHFATTATSSAASTRSNSRVGSRSTPAASSWWSRATHCSPTRRRRTRRCCTSSGCRLRRNFRPSRSTTRRRASRSTRTRAFLAAAFEEPNRELADLVGIDFSAAGPTQDVHDPQLPDEVVDDLE